jgi:hypothetical protein
MEPWLTVNALFEIQRLLMKSGKYTRRRQVERVNESRKPVVAQTDLGKKAC